jgi:hypothetical protein
LSLKLFILFEVIFIQAGTFLAQVVKLKNLCLMWINISVVALVGDDANWFGIIQNVLDPVDF